MSRNRLRFALAAGILDQGTASLVGLTLTVATGRSLGAAGLGSVALAVAVYLGVAGFHRALVLEPLAVQPADDRDPAPARAALTGALALGVLGAAVLYGSSLLLGGGASAALAGFAPWVPAALLAETARAAGFRDGRTTIGLAAHALWLVVMTGLLVSAGSGLDVGGASLAWGIGAAAAAGLACLRLGHLPALPGPAWTWWRTARPLGRWLALQTSVFTAGIQGAQLAVGLVAGPAALGTLKAAQTMFAPLTLLLPALNTPALPVVARTLRASKAAARTLSSKLTALLCAICVCYLAVAVIARRPLLELAFGSGFSIPVHVVWPVALEQLVVALSLGSFLVLKAAGDGRSVFVATAAGGATALAAVPPLAAAGGAAGAAWGMVAGAAAATAVALVRGAAAAKDTPEAPVRVRLATTR